MDVEKVIEAGARALWEMGCAPRQWRWEALPEQKKQLWRDEARACLTAALAEARAQGAVLAVVPKEIWEPMQKTEVEYATKRWGPEKVARAEGYNAAIAAMRAAELVL
jgi:hypothetical protein